MKSQVTRVQSDVLNSLTSSDKQPRKTIHVMNHTLQFLKHQAANVWYLYLMMNDLNDASILKKKNATFSDDRLID